MKRPDLSANLDEGIFRNFYYLKNELSAFCKQEGLQSSGSKLELTERISQYLKTGIKPEKKSSKKTIRAAKIEEINLDTLIENHFVCTEVHRKFYREQIGKSFSFNVSFQKWLKANGGKTYKESIAAYYQILEEKKKGKLPIDRQFEYNTYIRDFFAENDTKTLAEAIQCWKYKKSLTGHNKYEKADLQILEQSHGK